MKIDVTTTATLRPEIVEMTLWSFSRLLFKGHETRLILNVDPVGEESACQHEIAAIARRYFPNLIIRTPKEANYVDAVNWTWGQVETPLFFNVEDDFKLDCPLDLTVMAEAFEREPCLALLRLPKGRTDDARCCWYKKGPREKHAKWNGLYYEAKGLRYTGMPSLIRTEWMRDFHSHMIEGVNYEVQYGRLIGEKADCIRKWKLGVFAEPNTPITVHDIGMEWKTAHRICTNTRGHQRHAIKEGFTHWKKAGRPYTKPESVII